MLSIKRLACAAALAVSVWAQPCQAESNDVEVFARRYLYCWRNSDEPIGFASSGSMEHDQFVEATLLAVWSADTIRLVDLYTLCLNDRADHTPDRLDRAAIVRILQHIVSCYPPVYRSTMRAVGGPAPGAAQAIGLNQCVALAGRS